MILISRRVLISIAHFCNRKKLLGYGRIRVHKNVNKSSILGDMKHYFEIKSSAVSFHLIPFPRFQPILPKISYYPASKEFHLNGKLFRSFNLASNFFFLNFMRYNFFFFLVTMTKPVYRLFVFNAYLAGSIKLR